MIDQGLGPESPQGRDHLVRHRAEDDQARTEEDRGGQLLGQIVEGRPGGIHERSDTGLQMSKWRIAMIKGKKMIMKSEVKR